MRVAGVSPVFFRRPAMQGLWWVLIVMMLGGIAVGDGGATKGSAISASTSNVAVRSRSGPAAPKPSQAVSSQPILTPPPPSSAPTAPRPPSTPPPAMADAPTHEENDLHLPLDDEDPPVPAGPLYFATGNSTTVTAQMGSTALVPCVVRNIGDGMVSWIRRRDYHLLTVGLTTYSSDERFSAVHAQHSEDWTLQIKYVQETDAGLYECQVSSHPPTSIFIDLRVVEARADILGPSEKYLKSGSMLRLSCVLRQSTEPPVFVFWYHNNRMINYDRDRGVNVTSPVVGNDVAGAEAGGVGGEGGEVSEGGAASAATALGPDEEHASTLIIAAAQKAHSGNYSCVPNNAQPASTYVHILNAGENPAAMQHGGRGLGWLRSPSAWILAACLVASLSPTCCRLGGQARPSTTASSSPAEATARGSHCPKAAVDASAPGRSRRRRLLLQQRRGRRWHRRRGRRRSVLEAET